MVTESTQACRIVTVVTQDGLLQVQGPFRVGNNVEVIVLNRPAIREKSIRYPLRVMALRYLAPFDSVAKDAWDAAF